MGQLPLFVQHLLAARPPAGQGVHTWLFQVARQLHHHYGSDELGMRALISAYVEGCGRTVSDSEIEDAIHNSQDCAWRPGRRAEINPTESKWPKPNDTAIRAIVSSPEAPGGLADFWEASPLRFDEERATEAVNDRLFPGNLLLCCGWSNSDFATRHREEWRGYLAQLQFIVPSPMSAPLGRRKNAKPGEDPSSAHTLDNTGPRKFLVIESDQGTEQEQCAVLWHLTDYLPLVLVLHSGGKSLHGWFTCAHEEESDVRRFMRYAVHLGADPRGWTRSQFMRMPDGTRPSAHPRKQPVYYFSPEAVR